MIKTKMLPPQIDMELCLGCDPCSARRVCRTRAIVQIEPGELVYIDPDRCRRCAVCIPACAYAAIRLERPSQNQPRYSGAT